MPDPASFNSFSHTLTVIQFTFTYTDQFGSFNFSFGGFVSFRYSSLFNHPGWNNDNYSVLIFQLLGNKKEDNVE